MPKLGLLALTSQRLTVQLDEQGRIASAKCG